MADSGIFRHVTAPRAAAASAALVALATGILSWDASIDFAVNTLKVNAFLAFFFPAAGEGLIAVTSAAAIAVREESGRTRLYVWAVLVGAVALASVGNVKHSVDKGAGWWAAFTGLLAVAVAVALHMVVLAARAAGAGPARTGSNTAARTTHTRRRARGKARRSEAGLRVVLDDGRQVSPAHARRLQARAQGAAE